MPEITLRWRSVTCPALACGNAERWSRKISAIARAGRAMIGGLCRRLLLRCQRSEPIQRAHDRADHVGGYLRVERGGIEPGMSEQNLDQTHIGFLFEQVGGKAVAQCVRRHSPLD